MIDIWFLLWKYKSLSTFSVSHYVRRKISIRYISLIRYNCGYCISSRCDISNKHDHSSLSLIIFNHICLSYKKGKKKAGCKMDFGENNLINYVQWITLTRMDLLIETRIFSSHHQYFVKNWIARQRLGREE